MAWTNLGRHRHLIPRDLPSLLGVGVRALHASRGESFKEVEAARCVLVLEEAASQLREASRQRVSASYDLQVLPARDTSFWSWHEVMNVS